jgi:hypothetical protein
VDVEDEVTELVLTNADVSLVGIDVAIVIVRYRSHWHHVGDIPLDLDDSTWISEEVNLVALDKMAAFI